MPRRSSAVTPATTAAGYEQLVRRIRSIVMEAVRPGARLLVVTRGDDELLRFGNRVAWHFPRLDNGSYAGYHPASSEDAVTHLEELRERGGEYLVLPAPFFWWREYYPALFDHLGRNAKTAWDDDSCVIFAFEPAHARRTASPLAQPLKRLLEALLPEGATVAVVTSGDPSLLALERRDAIPFPGEGGDSDDESDTASALAQLAELSERDDAFLVIPHVAPSWVDGYPQFLEEVEARYTCIARRERVCTLYELNGHASRNA